MSATTVFGEDVPVLAPLGLAVLGLVAAVGAASLASAASSGAATTSRSAPPEAVHPPPPAAEPIVPPPAPAAERACARLLVTFAWSSPSPPESSRAPITRLTTWLAANPTATVLVDGHADGFGSDYANLELSRRRAASVAHLLEVGGITRDRLTVRGFGAFSPAEGRPVEAAENRRVVVQVRGGEDCPFTQEEVAQP